MLNIAHYQRNENQNHNEISPHTGQNGRHQKVYKKINVGKGWGKKGMLLQWEIFPQYSTNISFVEIQIGTAAMENSKEIP